MSSVQTAVTAIVTQFNANCPIASALRDTTEIGGPAFTRPTFNKAAVTNLNRATKLADAVWVRLGIDFVNGSATPQGIAPTSPTRTIGFVRQHIFYPAGFGSDFVLSVVDTSRSIFHRQTLSSGLLQFRDADAPVAIELPEDMSAGWARFDVQTAFWMTETV